MTANKIIVNNNSKSYESSRTFRLFYISNNTATRSFTVQEESFNMVERKKENEFLKFLVNYVSFAHVLHDF
jgi:hypothetical protein